MFKFIRSFSVSCLLVATIAYLGYYFSTWRDQHNGVIDMGALAFVFVSIVIGFCGFVAMRTVHKSAVFGSAVLVTLLGMLDMWLLIHNFFGIIALIVIVVAAGFLAAAVHFRDGELYPSSTSVESTSVDDFAGYPGDETLQHTSTFDAMLGSRD